MQTTAITTGIPFILSAVVYLFARAGVCEESYPLWELGAGVGVLTLPDYRGSDERRNLIFPIPYVVYRGEFLKVDRERIRGLFFKTERLELSFSLSGSPPVSSGDNKAREGMPDLDPTLELGPQLNILLWDSEPYKLTAQLPVRKVIATDLRSVHNAGIISNPILNLDVRDIGQPGWKLGLSGGPLFANRVYHDYFYGVDPADARPGRPAYDASGGYSGTQFTVALSKRFANFWTGAFMRAYDLHGTAFDNSPLLKQRTAFMAGFGVSWIFSRSDTRVMSDE
jgi:outer membrane scaffolding protein for murein synthesis (MipA/OmpV family)